MKRFGYRTLGLRPDARAAPNAQQFASASLRRGQFVSSAISPACSTTATAQRCWMRESWASPRQRRCTLARTRLSGPTHPPVPKLTAQLPLSHVPKPLTVGSGGVTHGLETLVALRALQKFNERRNQFGMGSVLLQGLRYHTLRDAPRRSTWSHSRYR
jgi:hypothetical protein